MTIDEAIANYQGISNYLQRYHAPDEEVQLQITNAKCAKWFTEVAEWLRELKEAKRLLGEALRTLNDGSCNKDCRQCKWNNNGCDYGCRFAWKYGDEVSALIGETDVDQ